MSGRSRSHGGLIEGLDLRRSHVRVAPTQVPYKREGAQVASWVPVSQRLQQERIIMVGKFIDEEYANRASLAVSQISQSPSGQSPGCRGVRRLGRFPPRCRACAELSSAWASSLPRYRLVVQMSARAYTPSLWIMPMDHAFGTSCVIFGL